ncbi:hypothetical protein HOP50_04g27840 [Chloropicon primus]|uniref:Rubisco LSMT substrate-binding domain-containing protein n=1 Tax=Chloropicon primus TaxID=1764295 RepID=A0A5B8MII9_9CHLO|nr:hypothetical protein A3770_04p27850 [Chloropicon primus]UPQ99476.1 hypothetical protein HOP50_04g27840 [Chloropicon primus]|eukprot:QDZ20267.1 hypothetical protein A3770_04p27850 [Chloropicon primus]
MKGMKAVAMGAALALGITQGTWAIGQGAKAVAEAEGRQSEGKRTKDRVQAFQTWIKDRGGDTEGIAFKECGEGDGKGKVKGGARRDYGTEAREFGVFAGRRVPTLGRLQRWAAMGITLGFAGREHLVATFPFDAVAITPATPLKDGDKGVALAFEQALASGQIDAREAVILYLILQERRGEGSEWEPYINVLPKRPGSSSLLSEADLRYIRGTNLFKAVQSLQAELPREFSNRILPVMNSILEADPSTERGSVSYDDYVKYFTTFWSRTLALPVPIPSEDGRGGMEFMELDSIVPGLDFANHSGGAANARWQLDPKSRAIQLYATRALTEGNEVFIKYGDRSNEQLMFQYGFAEEDNPNDSIMLHLSQFAEKMFAGEETKEMSKSLDEWNARVSIARDKGLPLKAFLCARDIDRRTGAAKALPEAFMQTLEVLVADPSCETGESTGKRTGDHSFGALALATKMFQSVVYTLESQSEGTGTLEADRALLERDSQASEEGSEGSLTSYQRMCIIYRMGQKRIARAYLQFAQEQLSKLMKE